MDRITTIIPITEVNTTGAERYLKKMAANITDKIDFLEGYINKCDVFIDMGCADGVMIVELKKRYPDIIYIGYDIDRGAIARAKNAAIGQDKIYFIDNPKDLLMTINQIRSSSPECKTMINMSSFLHEVFSYCDERQQAEFMDLIDTIKPNFMAIRDFHLEEHEKIETPSSAVVSKVESTFEAIPTVYEEMTKRGRTILSSWQHKYGSMAEKKESLVHLLLTSRYLQHEKDITEREFNENYMSVSEPKLKVFEDMGYAVKFKTRYNTPDFEKAVKESCRITSEEFLELPKTKVKMVLKRKKALEIEGR